MEGKLKVAIWMMTPWMIQENLAVAINPVLEYCIVDAHARVLDGKSKMLVATGLVKTLEVSNLLLNDVLRSKRLERKKITF